MTNEQLFEDLKQFIAAQTTDIRDDIVDIRDDIVDIRSDIADVKRNVERLEKKVDDGFAGIATAIEIVHARIDDPKDGVNVRLIRLEHRTA